MTERTGRADTSGVATDAGRRAAVLELRELGKTYGSGDTAVEAIRSVIVPAMSSA